MLALRILLAVAEAALLAMVLVCLALKAHEQWQDMMLAVLAVGALRRSLKDLTD